MHTCTCTTVYTVRVLYIKCMYFMYSRVTCTVYNVHVHVCIFFYGHVNLMYILKYTHTHTLHTIHTLYTHTHYIHTHTAHYTHTIHTHTAHYTHCTHTHTIHTHTHYTHTLHTVHSEMLRLELSDHMFIQLMLVIKLTFSFLEYHV